MGIFGPGKKKRVVALVDISSASVRGAYAHIEEGAPPTIYYTAYIPIDIGSGESAEVADPTAADMLRALERLADKLVREGAPVLHETFGSGEVEGIFVSVGAPWQETSVRVERIETGKAFMFTKTLLDEATKRNDTTIAEGRRESGEAVIATLLNGYDTARPFGRRVKRADLVILSSTIAKDVAEAVERTLRRTYHTHGLHLTAFAPVAYEVLRDMYPHQKDFLMLDVAGTATDVAVVKGGLLVDVRTVDLGVHDLLRAARTSGVTGTGLVGLGEGAGGIIDPARNTRFMSRISEVQESWLNNLKGTLMEFSTRHPLPRTMFLLADGDSRDFLRRLLDNDILRALWLSEEPLAIVPVLASQFSQAISTKGNAEGDAYMAMLALYYARRIAHLSTPDLSTEST